MPKESVADRNCKKVFEELEKDPSLTLEELGERCGFSKQKTWRIMKLLKKRYAVLGEVFNLNPIPMGKRMFMVRLERSYVASDSNLEDLWKDRCLMIEIISKEYDLSVSVYDSYYNFSTYEWTTILSADSINDLMKYIDIIRDVMDRYYYRIVYEEILWVSHRNGIRNEDLETFFKVNSLSRRKIVHGSNRMC